MKLKNKLILWTVPLICTCVNPGRAAPPGVGIIPKPAHIEVHDGSFRFTPRTEILVQKGSADARPPARLLAALLKRGAGFELRVGESAKAGPVKGAVFLTTLNAPANLGTEGYDLTVNPDSIVIRAPHQAGLFYGVQSLRQLLPVEVETALAQREISWSVPCVAIEDKPRFPWRGLLLDSARHFFPTESVKCFIDLMALYKFNTLHWHLVDDQCWTVPIDAYPNLTRTGVRGGPYRTLNGTWMGLGNGEGSGRFYTKDELREIVRYAAARQITIVPEIEMPGHSAALLASYPELLCTSHAKPPLPELGTHGTYTKNVAWDAYREVCVGNEKTFEMLQTILSEVMEVFPGPFVHIGGDEAQKRGWQNCECCQARIREAGLKNVEELQSYFVKRIGKFIQGKGRRLVGWDEIMQGGLADDAVVMSWTGIKPGQEAARKGFNVVFSPTSHCYFDASWQSIPTQKVYAFEPLVGLDPQEAKHVLGVQGNLWAEKISDLKELEYQAFPRACALAEVGWSVGAQRSWDEFRPRLGAQLKRLEALEVNYCREETPGAPPKR